MGRIQPHVEVTVRGVVLHESKLLCARLKPYQGSLTTKSDGYWCVPGGHLDPGEGIVDCCRREMVEETGIEPVIGNLLYVQQFEHKGTEYMEFFFHITNGADYLDIDLSKTTHGEVEIAEIGFIDPASNDILPKFLTSEPLAADAAKGVTRFFNYI